MFRPRSLTMTVNSISLKMISLTRSENSIAGIPSMIDVLKSPSSNSNSFSFTVEGTARTELVTSSCFPSNLSFHYTIYCGTGSTGIEFSSSTTDSLNLTFWVLRSPLE
ncbi:hypothetical protein ES332_A02G157600v1 [Gossypium tomentosum]|uniref:Uncharacterized protein n=1 Tax=Gossypium tomentosum TaxID=34277 RepID=A0A5D2RIU3_GOSTO|nr:hypothetical protein ES332_A02G157600v1 [Gossypium tomentosum]